MPFEKYLQDGDSQVSPYPLYDDAPQNRPASSTRKTPSIDSSTFSNAVQLQIPQFIYGGAPTLAPGGGAEVLPAAMFNQDSTSSWFINNGFTPKFAEDSFFQHSSSKTYSAVQDDDSSPQQHPHASTPAAPFSFDAFPPSTTPSSLIASSQHAPFSRDLSMYINASGMLGAQLPLSPQDFTTAGAAGGLTAPSPLGLPVYSASGFDLLSILARVAMRPHPRVVLGPVDMTCSFVVVDIRRHDQPIVYCSPTFCRLTGYEEREVLGKNCRFLQSPTGVVQKGEHRQYTSTEAVAHLRKSLTADKECQTSIVNYRKGGGAFINLVTVIPIAGGITGAPHEENEVVYHVGFQVDLTEQPNAILQKLRDGSYLVDYSGQSLPMNPSASYPAPFRDRKVHMIPPTIMSKDLKKLLTQPDFISSIPISTSTTVSTPLSSSEKAETQETNHFLHLVLLECSPDFIHVVSLKGSFLYVAPSVRRVLGYDPEELVGKSIADFTHPEDVVPLMRELKESSATGPSAAAAVASSPAVQEPVQQTAQGYPLTPRTVDLLFRARIKSGAYVWVECRGRLHVEPGKGRKAIVLSGRAREMSALPWSSVLRGGGVVHPVQETREDRGRVRMDVEKEFWGTISLAGTFLVVGGGVKDVLGWEVGELVGRAAVSVVIGEEGGGRVVEEELGRIGQTWERYHHHQYHHPQQEEKPGRVYCRMRKKDGGCADVQVVLHRPTPDPAMDKACSISPAPIIFQIRATDGAASNGTPSPPLSSSTTLMHSPHGNVFEELETSRGSSWQYELQQLKFANLRLVEEIAMLEAQTSSSSSSAPKRHYTSGTPVFPALALTTTSSLSSSSVSSSTSSSSSSLIGDRHYHSHHRQHQRRPTHPPPQAGRPIHMPMRLPPRHDSAPASEWSLHGGNIRQYHGSSSSGLKRSWDAVG